MRKSRARRRRGLKALFFTVLAVAALGLSLVAFSNRLMPAALELAASKLNAEIAANLALWVNDVTSAEDLRSDDFYKAQVTADGKISSLSANTLLINSLCARAADNLNKEIRAEKLSVSIPAGAASGVGLFSNSGPEVRIKLLPAGDVTVDYESSFTSAGINQTNFQIWLIVEAKTRVVNPAARKEITVRRKLPLVNTIINGEVPPGIFNY